MIVRLIGPGSLERSHSVKKIPVPGQVVDGAVVAEVKEYERPSANGEVALVRLYLPDS